MSASGSGGAAVSAATQREQLQADEVQFVSRVEVEDDGSGVLKLVIHRNNEEISGVLCTLAFVQSFGMFYSMIVGRLIPFDLPHLDKEYPHLYWAPWCDVLDQIRERLESATPSELNAFISALLPLIPSQPVSEHLRKLLAPRPYILYDILNNKRPVLSSGKVVLGSLWFYTGLYRWAAGHLKKQPVWSGTVGVDSMPIPTPFTEKVLERSFRDITLRPPFPINVPACCLPVPTLGSACASASSGSSGVAPAPAVTPAATPAAVDLVSSFGDVLAKVLAAAGDLPSESMPRAVSFLTNTLQPIYSVAKLAPMLAKLTDSVQLRAALASYTWPSGPDTPRVQLALQSWLGYIEDSRLIAATTSVKQQYLREFLALLPSAVPSWPTLAMQLMVPLTESLDAEVLSPLTTVSDRPSMARALMHLALSTPHIATLKTLKQHLHQLFGGEPATPAWAEQMLLEHLGPDSLAPARSAPPVAAGGPPPVSGGTPPASDRLGICLRTSGGVSAPWPALQAALAAHFQDDVFVGQQHRPMVPVVYASVSAAAWSTTSAGRSFWTIPLGNGLTGTITSQRGDGSPLDPPLYPATPQLFARQVQSPPPFFPPSTLGKRPRSPSPPRSRSPQPPRGPARPAPPGAAPPRRPGPTTIAHTPLYRSGARALVTKSWPAREGPAHL